ncbi:MAG: hypothetical protein WAM52_16410 [Steroidobacteraceae bacterium]
MPTFGDVPEHKDGTRHPTIFKSDWRGTIVDGNFAPVLREQYRVIRKSLNETRLEHPRERIVYRCAGALIDDPKYCGERLMAGTLG